MRLLTTLLVLLTAFALGCGASVEVTREVVVTREVEVTRPAPSPVIELLEVPVTVLVDSVRTVEVTKEVEVPVTVEVTRVSLQRIIETVEVPVTRVVESNRSRIPRELCEDYPHMVALLQSQRRFWEVKENFATSVEGQQVYRIAVENMSSVIERVDSNRVSVCGDSSHARPKLLHSMKSSEGWAMCGGAASLARNYANPLSWRSVPLGERAGAAVFVFGIRDHCFGGSTELVSTVFFQDYQRILELLE